MIILKRQKRREGATRFLEETVATKEVDISALLQPTSRKTKSQDVDILSSGAVSRRARFQRGSATSALPPTTTRSDGAALDVASAPEEVVDPEDKSGKGGNKKKKKRKITLPRRVKRVLSATAAITKTSDRPR